MDYNYTALKEKFWQEGYLHIENFFHTNLMERLNNRILDHFGETPDYWHNDEFLNISKVEVVPWFPQREGVTDFDVVGNDPRLLRLTAELLGEAWQEQYCMMMFSRKDSRGQAWHQDCDPANPEIFNMNRLIYTHSITPEVGGQTVVIPGTHKKGLISAGDPEAELEGMVILEPKVGDLILLHGHCWHRVLPVKGRYRVSTNFRCAPAGTPDDVTDVCVYRNMRYRFSTSEVVEERVPQAA